MSFQIKDTDYIIGIWYCHTNDKSVSGSRNCEMDVLCQVWRQSPESPWKSIHRYRYYNDTKIHESDDDKTWYEGSFGVPDGYMPEEEMLKRMNSVFDKLGILFKKKPDFIEIRDMGSKFADIVSAAAKPWMHIKKVSKEDNPEEYERLTQLNKQNDHG